MLTTRLSPIRKIHDNYVLYISGRLIVYVIFSIKITYPANRRTDSVGMTLVQRRRRWANLMPTLAHRFVFALI